MLAGPFERDGIDPANSQNIQTINKLVIRRCAGSVVRHRWTKVVVVGQAGTSELLPQTKRLSKFRNLHRYDINQQPTLYDVRYYEPQ